MTDKNYTHITLVVDRSGSMSTIRGDAEGGVNSFIDEQKAVEGKATLALFEFNERVKDYYRELVDIGSAEKYALHPTGNTALYDAIGTAIVATGIQLKALKPMNRPAKVVFVIVTDGAENASREYTHRQVAAMIAHQKAEYSWEFIFLAANLDAAKVGAAMNIPNNTQFAATSRGVAGTYGAMSSTVSAYRGADTSVIPQMPTGVDADGNPQ